METKTIYENKIEFDNVVVSYTIIQNRYSCYINDHDIYFGSKDKETIERKAKAMIHMKEKFLNDFPQYR